MAKPFEDYSWATNLIAEDKVDQTTGSSVVVLNREEPDIATKQNGVTVNGKLPRGYYNYELYAIGQHLDYLYAGEIDDMYQTALTTTTSAEVEARFGGTWADLGTDTVFGISLRGFRRTA